MHVIVNCVKKIEVINPDIIVKDKRLYNTKTDSYEGVDGDSVSFDAETKFGLMSIKGIVDGYTDGSYVKIRGVDTPYNAPRKNVQRVSVVSIDENIKDEADEAMRIALG